MPFSSIAPSAFPYHGVSLGCTFRSMTQSSVVPPPPPRPSEAVRVAAGDGDADGAVLPRGPPGGRERGGAELPDVHGPRQGLGWGGRGQGWLQDWVGYPSQAPDRHGFVFPLSSGAAISIAAALGPTRRGIGSRAPRLSSRQRPSSTSDLSQLHTPSSTTQPCPVSGWRTPRPTPALGVHFLPAADRAVAPLPAAVIGPVPCHRSRLFSQQLREPHLFGSSLWHEHVQCESSFVPAPCLHFVSVWFYCGLPFQ